MEALFSVENLLALLTLTGLEIILGIDNVIFIALISGALPPHQRQKARVVGLSIAFVLRILLLFTAAWIIGLTKPFITLFGFGISGRSLLLIIGGGFLVVKAFMEIREMFDVEDHTPEAPKPIHSFKAAIIQIIFIDIILSFDSIITAVGITDQLGIIIIAIIITIFVMLLSAKPIGDFISAYPSVKVVALMFILLLGVFLMLAGVDIDIPKAYLYFSMGFSMTVEIINILHSRKLGTARGGKKS